MTGETKTPLGGVMSSVDESAMQGTDSLASPPPLSAGEVGRRCFDGQELAQPRDREGRDCMLRFCDQDMRDQHYSDPAEAWDAWNRFSPAWNCTLYMAASFSEAELTASQARQRELEEALRRLAAELDRAATDRQAWADHPGIGGNKPRFASHLRGKRYGYSHAAQLIRALLNSPAGEQPEGCS